MIPIHIPEKSKIGPCRGRSIFCKCPLTGNEPPFSFRLRRKENGRSRSKEKALWCPQLAPMGQVWTRRGVPERDRWRSRLDSALGAGLILLNVLVLCHANGNCEAGQRPKGPAVPFAAALWFLAEALACEPYTGPDIVESLSIFTPNLYPSPQMRARTPNFVPSPAYPPEANSTAQVVCSEAEHTGPAVKAFRRPPQLSPPAPKCGHALQLSCPV